MFRSSPRTKNCTNTSTTISQKLLINPNIQQLIQNPQALNRIREAQIFLENQKTLDFISQVQQAQVKLQQPNVKQALTILQSSIIKIQLEKSGFYAYLFGKSSLCSRI